MISTILLIVLIAYAIIITYNYIITRMKLFEQQNKFLLEIRALQEEIQEQRTFSDMYYLNATETVVPEKLLWAKKVIGVNKYRANKNTMQTDENNFTGPYINIDVPEDWQEGDVFLICSMSSYESKNRTFSVFQYMDGQLHSIVQMDETYDWPTLLFSTVEHLLEKK